MCVKVNYHSQKPEKASSSAHKYTDTQTDGHTDRQTDIKTLRFTGNRIMTKMCRVNTNRLTNGKTGRQIHIVFGPS